MKDFRAKLRHWWRQEIRPLLIMALLMFSIRSSLADWNDVPTGSMKPTILEGDRVYVNKLAYDLKVPFTTWHVAQWSDPQRGDIVVFHSPKDGTRLVKRVIGLPGDTIELRDEKLIINGRQVSYDTAKTLAPNELLPVEQDRAVLATEQLPGNPHTVMGLNGIPAMRSFGPISVPQGRYFMMGDNRDNSYDSRYFGTVERRQILGRATAVVLSFNKSKHWLPRWHRTCKTLSGTAD